MSNSTGAFATPAMFEVLLDRIATNVYPSERFVRSAALSARSTDDLDRLLAVLGRQLTGQHLSPRRLHLVGLVAERRALFEPAEKVAAHISSDNDDVDDLSANELRSAVELLQQTSVLLDD